MSAEGLRVVCPTCGTVHEDNAALMETITAQAKEIATLKTKIDRRERARVSDREVDAVFAHWENHPARGKQRVVLDEARKKMIRDRIREQRDMRPPIENPVQRCQQAIDGLMSRPYVRNGGGRSADPNGARRYASLEHALRDAKTMEACIGYASEPANVVELRPRRQVSMYDPHWRPLDRAIAALRREFGCDSVTTLCAELNKAGRYDEWWSVCPVKPDISQPLRLREMGGIPGGSLDVVCVHGCLPSQVLQAIRRLEAKQDAAKVELSPGAIA